MTSRRTIESSGRAPNVAHVESGRVQVGHPAQPSNPEMAHLQRDQLHFEPESLEPSETTFRLIKWSVEVGDKVQLGAEVARIESNLNRKFPVRATRTSVLDEILIQEEEHVEVGSCLLYTSDAADE